MTVVAPLLAWWGFGVWSLVGEQLAGEIARGILLWGVHRAWTPRLGWDQEAAAYFWSFGRRLWTFNNLNFALQSFDDFWIGSTLGPVPLGFYSRAYDLAGYAERVLGGPLSNVVMPTLARFQSDRLRLSQAFFRAMSLMVRLNGGAATILILAAPEAILLLLGERWLPMVPVFRLLVVFILLQLVARPPTDLLLARGEVGLLLPIQAVRLSVFVPAVIVLAWWWGIVGVAAAASLASLVGALRVLQHTRRLVDYSPARLFVWPGLACAAACVCVALSSDLFDVLPAWPALGAKMGLAAVAYAAVLALAEREQLLNGVRMVWRLLRA
jgi:PST family polysaccharide transporter